MPEFEAMSHGARGDGATLDTQAIQSAIDAAFAAGGGTVTLSSGHTFVSGSLLLRSNVTLNVEAGAVLDGSSRWEDYTIRPRVGALSAGVVVEHTEDTGAFIACEPGSTNISIVGGGVIDGAGRHFITEDLGSIYRCPNERPFTIFLIGCERVIMRDITVRDGALWMVRLSGCSDVVIDGIRIDADLKMPNNDGIDIDRCQRVSISNCHIRCGDDAITLKATEEFEQYGACEDIVVTNCTLMTTSSALVVGVDATGDIRNVTFSNCVIRSSNRGLSVSQAFGGTLENILFTDMIVETRLFDDGWWGRGEPIYVSSTPWHTDGGHVRNVRFRNILARSENGVFIEAVEPGSIDGVTIEGLRLELDSWSGRTGGTYDRRPIGEGEGIFERVNAAFYIANAGGVELRDCVVIWPETRPGWFGDLIDQSGSDVLQVNVSERTTAGVEAKR